MLRRKLLIIFGSLVALVVIMAVCGLWVLYDMLQRIDHINTQAASVIGQTSRLDSALTAVEIDLYELRLGKTRYLDVLIDDVESVGLLLVQIGQHYLLQESEAEKVYRALQEQYPEFENRISSLATAQDAELSQQYIANALAQTVAMRKGASAIRQEAWEHGRLEQDELTERFRRIVLGMALGGVLVIYASIMVLLRAARIVLKPMDKLVEASRRFAHKQFDYRAQLDEGDEFSELAKTYNELAEGMQNGELRQMATLGHLALTLNHELNNAMANIDLQLQVLSRQANGNEKFALCIGQIREILQRMVQTVESLKHIRRVVLTDYVGGTKMLDLRRSTFDEADESQAIPGAAPDAEGS